MNEAYDKLMQYALRILSKKRYTVSEMRNKLWQYAKRRKALYKEDFDRIIERLKELKYLDDDQYIQDYVAERIKIRPRGRRLLMLELRYKGIPQDLVKAAFEEIEIDEERVACVLLTKRVKRWQKLPREKQRMKAYQLLYSRGFGRDAIYKALDACYNRGEERSS